MTSWLEVGANVSGNYLKNNRVPGANIGSTIVARAVDSVLSTVRTSRMVTIIWEEPMS